MSISIIVPTYNSASFIRDTMACLSDIGRSTGMDYEIIAVDDASTDETLDILHQCCTENEHIRLIRNTENRGQQLSTLTAIMSAQGDYIVTIDDDMEYHPTEIPLLLRTLHEGGFDLVYGVPNKIKRGLMNLIMYNAYLLLLKSGNEQRKTSFRIFKKEIAERLPAYQDVRPFVLDYFLCSLTDRVEHVSVKYSSRSGTSRYSLWMYLDVLKNAIEIKKKGIR